MPKQKTIPELKSEIADNERQLIVNFTEQS